MFKFTKKAGQFIGSFWGIYLKKKKNQKPNKNIMLKVKTVYITILLHLFFQSKIELFQWLRHAFAYSIVCKNSRSLPLLPFGSKEPNLSITANAFLEYKLHSRTHTLNSIISSSASLMLKEFGS